MNNLKVAKSLKTASCAGLTIIGVLVFLFALVSGSEAYGGGFLGIIKNSPNALPWAFLLLLVWFAWEKELIGGIIITVLGIGLLIFFNSGSIIFPSVLVLTLLITLLGILTTLSGVISYRVNSGRI